MDLTAYIESDDCKHALREYTGSGQLVREISLPTDVTEPQHALQLGSQFVVSHAGTLHRVCLLGQDGQVGHLDRKLLSRVSMHGAQTAIYNL